MNKILSKLYALKRRERIYGIRNPLTYDFLHHNMHHLHVWKLDDENVHLEAHINMCENIPIAAVQEVRERIEKMLKDDFGINHVTLQTEYQSCKNHDELIQK